MQGSRSASHEPEYSAATLSVIVDYNPHRLILVSEGAAAQFDMPAPDDILCRVAFTADAGRRFMTWGTANILICLALCVLATQSPETLDRWDQVLPIGPDSWRDTAPWLERPLVWVSYAFGTLASILATAAVAGLLVAKKQLRVAACVVLVIGGTTLITNLLKLVVDLPRPVVEDPILQYSSSAMPSGHASNIAAAVTAACVLSALFVRNRAVRRLVLVVGVLVALVVGLDRLMLGVHTLTEVVAGYTLGVGVALLTTYPFDPAVRIDASDLGDWP